MLNVVIINAANLPGGAVGGHVMAIVKTFYKEGLNISHYMTPPPFQQFSCLPIQR